MKQCFARPAELRRGDGAGKLVTEIPRRRPRPLSEDRTAFEDMIWRSTRFWRRRSAAGSDTGGRRVLVDLMVDHPVYYVGNLIIAKYLELIEGLTPWALVSSAEDQKIILLAKSFGIEQFTFVRDEVAKAAPPAVAPVLGELEGLRDAELRRRVNQLTVNDLPLGELLYDTYVRETRQLTLREIDDDFKAYTALLLNYSALYDTLFQALDVGAVVLGHLTYSRFGTLARMAGNRGAAVYARYGGKGMRIQKRTDLEGARDVICRITPDLVDAALAADGEAAVKRGEETLARRMGGVANEFLFLNEDGYSPDRAFWSKADFCRELSLDPDRPKGLVMVHAFPDANHNTPHLPFDDFYDWYLQTLELARATTDVDWLIKHHPNLTAYSDDPEPVVRSAEMAAEHPHIHVVTDDMNTGSFPEIADFLVTVNGRSGLEFAGCGVPSILGGNGFFAGLGFSQDPADPEEYAVLIGDAARYSMDPATRERALVANDLFFRRMLCDCAYLPDTPYNFWRPFDEITFWRGYAAALDANELETDELYRGLAEMASAGAATMLRPD